MKVKIGGPAEFDRREGEVRFVAIVGKQAVSVTLTTNALFIIGEALGMSPSEPLIVYAASGQLLNRIVEDTIIASGELQPTYLVTATDVLRTTGSEVGLPHVPKPWKKA